ncbi:MAG: DUF3667 domain-containing protein [Marinilabiliaceae bacterium]|nr:DUF3667 domain-containing protein [Marinilabiliaceae bacterium]
MISCKKCNEQVIGNYCSNCGYPSKLKKIDGQYLINEIVDFFFASRGMLYTINKMLLNPGDSVRRFITEDRYRFVKPITFVVITSLIYTLVNYIFNISANDYYQQSDELVGSTAGLIINWMLIEYVGYANLITGFFVAFCVKLCFKKASYNIYEIFILLCFVTGITNLFISIAAIIQGITHISLIQISTYIGIFYFTWAIGQFFDRKKAKSYIKALLSFILGSFIFGILIGIVGTIIDVIIKS